MRKKTDTAKTGEITEKQGEFTESNYEDEDEYDDEDGGESDIVANDTHSPQSVQPAPSKSFALKHGEDYNLIILADERARRIAGSLYEYAKISPVSYTTSLDEVRSNLMYRSKAYILAVAETGSGRLTTGGLRGDLMKILDSANAANGSFAVVFHTEKLLIDKEQKRRKSDCILYKPYLGTGDIVITLLRLMEMFNATFSGGMHVSTAPKFSLDEIKAEYKGAAREFFNQYVLPDNLNNAEQSYSDRDCFGDSLEQYARFFKSPSADESKAIKGYAVKVM